MLEIAGEDFTNSLLETFECKKNSDVANFLKYKSIDFENRDVTRTYLIVEMIDNEITKLFGYFSIGTKSIELPENLSGNKRRDYDGFNKKAETINCYLLGQLGKNDMYSDEISGVAMLKEALLVILKCYELIGGRTVLVECQDKAKLKKFYTDNNFYLLQKDETTQLLQYILTVKHIKLITKVS